MNKNFEPEKIKAIAIDLDGTTLLPNTTLGERTVKTIHKLIKNGMQVIISTGRAIEASERLRSTLEAEGPMVFFNGAVVMDVPKGKILYTNGINMDVVGYGADIARELDIHYQVYLPAGISPQTGNADPAQKRETLVIEKYSEEAKMYFEHTGIVPVVADLKKLAALPKHKGAIKGMYIANPALHDKVRKKMYARFGEQIIAARSYPAFLEIINKGVSKGEGLKIAMEYRGLKPQEVVAFGDEENDLPMFEAAGWCGAPASARSKIRKKADFIFASNAEEGLAGYLEKTFL